MPIGTILPYVGNLSDIPSGWHLCDGTDGTPNLLDNRFLEGDATIGMFKEPGLPNITGKIRGGRAIETDLQNQGAFELMSAISYVSISDYNGGQYLYNFDASLSNSIYGNSNTVQPRSYTVYFIIKVK